MSRAPRAAAWMLALDLAACAPGDHVDGPDAGALDVPGAVEDGPARESGFAADLASPDVVAPDAAPGDRPALRVVTFNTGSGPDLPHDRGPDDGYGAAEAALTDTWYGNGLAWSAFVEDARAFLAAVRPDIVVFQEIFWTGECAGIPPEARAGFVCASWTEGDPTVAERVLGLDYQVICHPDKPDKCLGVRREFGTFDACGASFCLAGARGRRVEGCGSGARVAAGRIVRTDGRAAIHVVHIHGSSGIEASDAACRVAQFEAALSGDDPLISDTEPNIVLGDLNTDPGRMAPFDPSAARIVELADAAGLAFVTAVGPDATPTYGGFFNIDHVLSDGFRGTCSAPGIDGPWPAVTQATFFDHHPVVCDLAPAAVGP